MYAFLQHMKTLSVLSAIIVTGCTTLKDDRAIGFGERAVIAHNQKPFPVDVYINRKVIKKDLQLGEEFRYMQGWDDPDELLVEVFAMENGEQVLLRREQFPRREYRSPSSEMLPDVKIIQIK